MGIDDNVGNLEDAALKRKEHLAALNKKFRGSDDEKKKEEDLPSTKLLFRNYKPISTELKEQVADKPELASIEEIVKEQLENSTKPHEFEEVEITSLAPMKVTFDLKRGIQAQLDKLERRTEKVIAELIRQRLKEGKQQDFLIAVNAGARAEEEAHASDDD